MTTTTETESERTPLSRDRILEAAISLADEQGLDAVTMRRLGYELGVEAMSLYNHIDNKGDLRSDADSASSWLVCPKCGAGPLREVEAGARQQCRELWPVLWDLFPSWSVQAEDSS